MLVSTVERSSTPKEKVGFELAEEEKKPPIVHSTDVWYPDSGVVIQAGYTHFRVHRSILIKHSLKLNQMILREEEKSR